MEAFAVMPSAGAFPSLVGKYIWMVGEVPPGNHYEILMEAAVWDGCDGCTLSQA